jgi:hypothetical protein
MTTDRARAAQAALEIPLFTEVLDDLEKAATNHCILAPINDDETRRNAAAEVRAIRKLRSTLEAIAREGQSTSRTAPA